MGGSRPMQGPADPLEWAKHPRSPMAMERVVEGAKSNRHLREIFAAHVAAGVCDAEGRLLLRWDGLQWRR
jgi:hypothetical protein